VAEELLWIFFLSLIWEMENPYDGASWVTNTKIQQQNKGDTRMWSRTRSGFNIVKKKIFVDPNVQKASNRSKKRPP